ncbi:nif11 domain/cupin domain protein [Mycoplasmopsis bovigenitalium]|uniref:Nif11 domain/cupin domain protein n=1 Tax=Mycoplasmopsis bovigenitalium TaxID=2112 RepID=A0A449A8E1_9BACT|nr:cupin domain-containing protein [Mycoplasmopsis bovigenitalium]VEU60532.1 nif11 domain/cupin domain protein [Mycoplasmopsis bovigenitalium]
MKSNINIECNFIELLQTLNINNGEEYTHKIIDSGKNRVEIIYSKNASTNWLEENNIELAFLIKGEAKILDSNNKIYNLKQGDCLRINSNQRHKVLNTSTDSIWIAIHLEENND